MLLPVKANTVLEKSCCKKNTVRLFYSGGSKMVFELLIEVVTDYVINIFINVKKAYLEEMFTRVFCSYRFSFYYCPNNILYILICINFGRVSRSVKAATNLLKGFEKGA